jgi:catechol 2,3-dioxygenase-like lactoylglutathione lyase family enzyme
MHLEHVNLTVNDLDRSIAFYADLFDLHVRWKGPLDGSRLAAHVGDERTYLALFQATGAGAVDHDYTRPGVNHFGFVVDDLDDVQARLGGLGATVHLEADYEPGRRIYFLDPDGYEVEVVEYPRP